MALPVAVDDPFGTAAIRERVTAAWAASPARFREDANAEEDLAHGAYRDRLLVELAQNAADAAARAGVPGELRLSLVDGELRAANLGAPLEAAGVEALATLRASAKRDGASVGRFGVGFAAVLTVTDEPVVRSTSGGVRFSAADTLDVVAAIPMLAEELDRRGGRVPVLRLPWPAEPLPPGVGADTEVVLPLRPGTEWEVRRALHGLDATLLLALPALRRLVLPDRELSRVDGPDGTVELRDGREATRWRICSAHGTLPPELLASRPIEERDRPEWTVRWALPLGRDGAPAAPARQPVVHAPTPSDELLSLPAVLIGTFPLASDRRHVTPGPITDLLIDAAGRAYADLVAGLPTSPALLSLVPRPAFAAADLDAALSRAALQALRSTPWLPVAAPAPLEPAVQDTGADAPAEAGGDALPRAGADAAAEAGRKAPAEARPDGPAEARGEAPAEARGEAPAEARPDGPAEARGEAPVEARPDGPAEARGDGLADASGEAPSEADEDAAVVPDLGTSTPGLSPGVAAGPAQLTRVAPGDAVAVDAASDELVAVLADLLPGLLPAAWSGRGHAAPLGTLGVRRLSTADIVDLVSGVDRPAEWWRRLFGALADSPDREALAALPVPLADGRLVTGVRGLLLPDADLPAAAVAALGLRVVHPEAAHPGLERLGAVPATARGVLADERVRTAVEASYDEEDPAPVVEAVLALVAGARPEPDELPWLAELALRAEDGDWYPAGELVLPGSPLAAVVRPDAPFGTVAADLVERWGEEVLAAVGVLRTFAVLRVDDVEVDPDAAEHDLADEAEWMDALLDRLPPQPVPPRLPTLVAVRDLDLVRDDAWDRALPLVAALPRIRPAVPVVLADGSEVRVPSYTTWWLSTHRTIGGRRPDRLRRPDATDLAGLYDEADAEPALLELAGVLGGLDEVLADPDRAVDLLHRLGDDHRTVTGPTLRTAYARLATALDGVDPDLPDRVRVAPDRVTDRDRAVVLDAPYLLPVLVGRQPVPAGGEPAAVADLLDLPMAGELDHPTAVTSDAVLELPWAEVPGAGLAAERLGTAPPAATVAVHEGLTVGEATVGWWPDGDTDHIDADAGPAALGRALAWRLGAWRARAAAVEALADADAADRLRGEDAVG